MRSTRSKGMQTSNSSNWRIYAVLAICVSLVACNDKAKNALKSELNKTNFNLVDPANDWTFAGGLVVYDNQNPKAGATFYGLPANVEKPQAVPATAVWGAEDMDNNFTVQALVSGLGQVVNGVVAFNHSNKTTLAQINASGTRVPNPENIVANSEVAKQVKSWLNGGRFSVYIVNTVLNTTSLSAKTSSSTGVSAAFGSDIKKCQPTSGSGAADTGNNAAPSAARASSAAGGTTNGGAVTGGNTSTPTAGTGNTSGTTSPGGSSKPTANLQVCENDA